MLFSIVDECLALSKGMRQKDFCTLESGGVRYFSLFVLSELVLLLFKEILLKGNFYSDRLSDFVSCLKWIC